MITCHIRLRGEFTDHWMTWFDPLRVTRKADGSTELRGDVADQAALHGLLKKVRDMGITIQLIVCEAKEQTS